MRGFPPSARSKWARLCAAALLLAAAGGLAGCSSAIDHIPTWAGGYPEGIPQRPAEAPPYPAVHDMPPPRSDVALTDEERKRLKDELIATRARTEANNPAPSLSGPAPAAGATPKP